MNKGAWSKQEDQKLIDYIRKHGEGCWRTLPKAAGKYQYYIWIPLEILTLIPTLYVKKKNNNKELWMKP